MISPSPRRSPGLKASRTSSPANTRCCDQINNIVNLLKQPQLGVCIIFVLALSSISKFYYRIENQMKLRRTRVLQTGSSNSRCVTAQGSTRYGWAQASFKTNAPHSELDSSPKRTQSTMGIRREQEAEDTWKRFGGKSEKEIVDERERLYKDDIQNTKLVHFSN